MKHKKTISKLILFSLIFLFNPALTLAAQCMVNGRKVPCNDFPWGIFLVIFIPLVLLIIAGFIFWIKMIIDCAKNEKENKALWILIILFFSFMGALIYYFAVKRKRAQIDFQSNQYVQPSSPVQPMQANGTKHCPNCGAPVNSEDKFCTNCGNKLS